MKIIAFYCVLHVYRGVQLITNYQQPVFISSQGRYDTFSTYQPQSTVPHIDRRQQYPPSMSHLPRQNPSLANANNQMYGAYGDSPDGASGASVHSGKRLAYTDVSQLQQQPVSVHRNSWL